MNENMCQYFKIVWDDFPDALDNDGNYNFETSGFCETYCDEDCNENCNSDLDKFNSGCLYLFKTFFKDSDSFNDCANKSTNIVQYIWAWLGYILSLKKNEGISNLNDFYEKYIKEDEEYNNPISDVDDYKSYSDLINENKELMTVDIKDMPKFYTLVQTLCKMYIECNEKNSDCTKCSQYAEEFSNKYNELNCNSDTNINSSCSKIWSTLLTDYNNFKKQFSEKCSHCSNSTTLPDIKAIKSSAQNSEEKAVQDNAEKSRQDNTDISGQDNTDRSGQGDTDMSVQGDTESSVDSSLPGHEDIPLSGDADRSPPGDADSSPSGHVDSSPSGHVDSSPSGHVGNSLLGHVSNSVSVSEFTPSNSSTSSKLIPVLSIFVVIPIFLGIAYKYSLFGVDKLFQRQYLRKKLKKVKKK
ncbi:CIR protein PIR protein [Plasmodium vinckei]|uniref:CIR protein PIR protein n=1 Tax=Plasmodium vinckei TaxID=5860 RepID=A0A6V7TCU2_PLAVN|nr:CIR protein PIR protein [Plasmodium vinckei]